MINLADFDKLLSLLQTDANNDFAKGALAYYITSKAFEGGHLYADMNLGSRAELNRLMMDNYPSLAAKRPSDKRWKKFLFDEIESIAPACHECKDTENCFKCELSEQIDTP
jgi:nitrogen fixation protein NifQ